MDNHKSHDWETFVYCNCDDCNNEHYFYVTGEDMSHDKALMKVAMHLDGLVGG